MADGPNKNDLQAISEDDMQVQKFAIAEQQIFYGPPRQTDELHNSRWGNEDATHKNFANSAFTLFELTVTAPLTWHFIGEPFINYVSGDKSAFDWNCFSIAHDRVYLKSRTSNEIVYYCWAGSHSIQINLACVAIKD